MRSNATIRPLRDTHKLKKRAISDGANRASLDLNDSSLSRIQIRLSTWALSQRAVRYVYTTGDSTELTNNRPTISWVRLMM